MSQPLHITKIKKALISTGIIASLTFSFNTFADSLDFKETRNLNLVSSDISEFKIDVGAGFLKISGDDSIDKIEVIANIETMDDDFTLNLEKIGDKAILTSKINTKNIFNWGNNSPRIDLTVKVPSDKSLLINDGSGKIIVSNINNNVSITDGSGSIKINYIKGDLEIVDGSGSLVIGNITGNVLIDDGSGSIDANQIGGTLKIDDGSGSMDVTNIGGLVTIDDGSGSIDVKHLKKGLTIISEGSGGLRMSDVEGPVKMK